MQQVDKFEFNSRDHFRIIVRGRKVNLINERTKQFSSINKRAPFVVDLLNPEHLRWIFKEFNRIYEKYKLKFINFNNGNTSDEPAGYVDHKGHFYPYGFSLPFKSQKSFSRWLNSEKNSHFSYAVFELEK